MRRPAGTRGVDDDFLDRAGGKASEEKGMEAAILPRIKVYNAGVPASITVQCVGDAGLLKHTFVTEVAVKGTQRISASLKDALHISENVYVCRVQRAAVEDFVSEEEAEPVDSDDIGSDAWDQIRDESSGDVYFYNKLTGESQRRPPSCPNIAPTDPTTSAAAGAELSRAQTTNVQVLDLHDYRSTFDDFEIKNGDMLGIYGPTVLTPEEKEKEEEERRERIRSRARRGDLMLPGSILSSILMHPDIFTHSTFNGA